MHLCSGELYILSSLLHQAVQAAPYWRQRLEPMMRMLRWLTPLILLFLPTPVGAQPTTSCTPVQIGTPIPLIPGQSRLSFVSVDHNTTGPGGVVVTDYLGEVFQAGGSITVPVTNWTIPKTALTPVTGANVPADCYETIVPALAPLLPANTYMIRVTARGGGVAGVSMTMTNPFFLRAAPRAPTASVLVNPGS